MRTRPNTSHASVFELEALESRSMLAASPFAVFASPSVEGTSAAAALDLNGDGLKDLVVNSGRSLAILVNAGNGSFQPPVLVALPPGAVAAPGINNLKLTVGDYNGDGRDDVAVSLTLVNGAGSDTDGRVYFYRNAGGTTLVFARESLVNVGYSDVTALDTDGDGRDEIVTDQLSIYRLFNRRFVYVTQPSFEDVFSFDARTGVIDVENDGIPEFIAFKTSSSQAAPSLQIGAWYLLRRNLTTGTYSPTLVPGAAITPTNAFGYAPAPETTTEGDAPDGLLDGGLLASPGSTIVRDINLDGFPDIVLVSSQSDEAGSVSVRAVINRAGTLDSAPTTIYEESAANIRARGGHGPTLPVAPRHQYAATITIAGVVDDADLADQDLILRIDSAQRTINPRRSQRFTFDESFALRLTPVTPGDANTAFVANDADIDDAPPVRPGALLHANFFGDSRFESVVLSHRTLTLEGYRAVHVLDRGAPDLNTTPNPSYVYTYNLRSGANGYGVFGGSQSQSTDIALRDDVRVSFTSFTRIDPRFPALSPNAPLADLSARVYLDTNNNGVLDSGDRQISSLAPTTTTIFRDGESTELALTVRRRPAWGPARSTNLFLVFEDQAGRTSIPLVAPVVLT